MSNEKDNISITINEIQTVNEQYKLDGLFLHDEYFRKYVYAIYELGYKNGGVDYGKE